MPLPPRRLTEPSFKMAKKDYPTLENTSEEEFRQRKIKSFALRVGRKSPAQETALEQHWPSYGLDPKQPLDPVAIFGRNADTVLEIGFGNGASLAEMAANSPELNFIGIEVHTPGVAQLLIQIEERGLKNVRIYNHDAIEVLDDCIADNSLSKMQLFFPDPWHKKRHNKRRIVKTELADTLHRKLQANGLWHIATDWEDYANHCVEVLEPYPGFENTAGKELYILRPDSRPLTKFEKRGHRLGHGVWDLMYKKI